MIDVMEGLRLFFSSVLIVLAAIGLWFVVNVIQNFIEMRKEND